MTSVAQIKRQLMNSEEFKGHYYEGKVFFDDYERNATHKTQKNPESGTYVGFFPHKETKTIFCAKIFSPQTDEQKVINELSINAKLHGLSREFFIGIKDIYYHETPEEVENITFAVVYSNRPIKQDMSAVAAEESVELIDENIITEKMAAELFEKVCYGLEILHIPNVDKDKVAYVHCDIKPQNLLKSASNKVYIIDFGAVDTDTGCTKQYASPEQLRNVWRRENNQRNRYEEISQSSDYWSLGMSIAKKILGPEAFRFESTDGLTSKYFMNPRIKAASDQLVNLLCKLLEYDKHKRMYNALSIGREKSKIVDDDWFKKHNKEKEDRDGKIPVYSIWRRVGGEDNRMASRVFWVTQIAELESKVMGQIKKREKMLELRVVEHPREAYGRIKPDKVTNMSLTGLNINSLATIKCLLVFYSYTE